MISSLMIEMSAERRDENGTIYLDIKTRSIPLPNNGHTSVTPQWKIQKSIKCLGEKDFNDKEAAWKQRIAFRNQKIEHAKALKSSIASFSTTLTTSMDNFEKLEADDFVNGYEDNLNRSIDQLLEELGHFKNIKP